MVIGTLYTSSGLELPCVILPIRRPLDPIGQEVMVYCQNRLAKGYLEDDNYVIEIEIVVEWCMIPELQEMLYG